MSFVDHTKILTSDLLFANNFSPMLFSLLFNQFFLEQYLLALPTVVQPLYNTVLMNELNSEGIIFLLHYTLRHFNKNKQLSRYSFEYLM